MDTIVWWKLLIMVAFWIVFIIGFFIGMWVNNQHWKEKEEKRIAADKEYWDEYTLRLKAIGEGKK